MTVLQKKQQLNVWRYCLIYLFFLASCSGSAPLLTATPTATSTPPPTRTATPTPMPILTMENLDAQFPDGFLQYDPDFTDFQSGTYAISAGTQIDSSDSLYNSIYYISLNRALYGDLAIFRQDMLDSLFGKYADSSSDKSLTTNLESSEYMIVVAELVQTDTKYDQINEMIIRSAVLRTGEQHIWKATFHPESGMQCSGVSLSPDHEWVAGNCWKEGENYIYFLSIRQGTVVTLHPLNNPCLSREYDGRSWWFYDWSPDSKWFSTSCQTSPDVYTSCLVSPVSGEFSCRPNGYFRPEAWSPDGSKVAVLDHQTGLLITDVSCLKNALACPEYFRVPIPPDKSLTSITWSQDGKTIVWSMNNAAMLGIDSPTTIWVADLESGEQYNIGWADEAKVYSITPDGKWILANNNIVIDDIDWSLLAIDGSTVRRVGANFGSFLGWLVVP